jgi:non-ribosomal peptide synthase protein (TIGR01720 family)
VGLAEEGTTFAEWARRLEEFAGTQEVLAEVNYWLGDGDDLSGNGGGGGGDDAAAGFELPVDYEGGANLERDAAYVTASLTQEETRALLREVPAAYRTEVNDALLCALGRALWRWTGSARPVVELEGHGREEFAEDIDTSRTVGWFTTIFPVGLEAGGSVGDDLKAVKERLRRVPRRGLGYGLLRYVSGDEATRGRLAALGGGRVVFNYLGQLDGAVSGGSMFRGARESAGASRWGGGERTHVLSINASVAGGRLAVSWGYGKGLHRRETIERAAGWMAEELRALIKHCREEGAGGFTPSDFPEAALSQEELDDFIASVG